MYNHMYAFNYDEVSIMLHWAWLGYMYFKWLTNCRPLEA